MPNSISLKIIAVYQYAENYASWDWDGKGDCPQYWKYKGGHEEILFDGLTIAMAQEKDIIEWAKELALGYEHHDMYTSQQFLEISIVPSNQIDRYDAMEAEMQGDYEYLTLFDTQEIYTPPSENDPIDRFDALTDELGLGGL